MYIESDEILAPQWDGGMLSKTDITSNNLCELFGVLLKLPDGFPSEKASVELEQSRIIVYALFLR